MAESRMVGEVGVSMDGHVAIVEIRRAPNNFFDVDLITDLADAFEELDNDPACRAIVLAAQGKAFCAGADFSGRTLRGNPSDLYHHAIRLFRTRKPVVAAVQGPAIGGGVGVALVGDFRVTCPQARWSVNFNRLGLHPGFGLSTLLPRLIGQQQASLLMFTGRRIDGEEAVRIGLADVLASDVEAVRPAALALAREIAESGPLAVQDTRATMRAGLAEAVERAVKVEAEAQGRHFKTADFAEGVKATAERRLPVFTGT